MRYPLSGIRKEAAIDLNNLDQAVDDAAKKLYNYAKWGYIGGQTLGGLGIGGLVGGSLADPGKRLTGTLKGAAIGGVTSLASNYLISLALEHLAKKGYNKVVEMQRRKEGEAL